MANTLYVDDHDDAHEHTVAVAVALILAYEDDVYCVYLLDTRVLLPPPPPPMLLAIVARGGITTGNNNQD